MMTGGMKKYLWGKKRAVGAGAQMYLFFWYSFSIFPHISQLKSACELDKIKGLKLEELWLKGNPLCDTFPDQPTYIRLVVITVTLSVRETSFAP